jgi:hypothetical protein
MAIQYSTTHRTNAITDVTTLASASSSPYILIYTGSPPANCGTAASGTLLVSLPCSATFGTVSSGVLTANAITTTNAANSGTAGYFRLCTTSAGSTVIAQGTVNTSGGDLNLNTTSLVSGNPVAISSFVLTANGA